MTLSKDEFYPRNLVGQHRIVPTRPYPIFSLLRFVHIWNFFVLLYYSAVARCLMGTSLQAPPFILSTLS